MPPTQRKDSKRHAYAGLDRTANEREVHRPRHAVEARPCYSRRCFHYVRERGKEGESERREGGKREREKREVGAEGECERDGVAYFTYQLMIPFQLK